MKHYLLFLLLYVCSLSLFSQNTRKWQKLENNQTTADALVENRKADWGLSEKDALLRPNEMPKTDNLGFKHYRFQQTYENIPIEGAEWLVHEKNGIAKTANGNLVNGLHLSTTPSLSEEQALQYALNSINAEVWAWEDDFLEEMLREDTQNDNATHYPTGKLVIISPDAKKGSATAESYRLAYKFDVFAMQPLTRQEIYIDAQNGELVDSYSLIFDADVAATGNAHYACENPVSITASSIGSNYRLYDTARNIHTRTADDFGYTPNIDVTSEDTFFDEDPDAVAVHYATSQFYDYLFNVHQRNSIDGNGYKLKSWVHYNQNWNNAAWMTGYAVFGDGDNQNYSALTSLDVVAHEFTHGLTRRTARLKYWGESGALNEGISDIFGTLVEFYAEPDCADWLLGEDIVLQNGKTAIRNMSNPNDAEMTTQQPDTYGGNYWHTAWTDHGGVHINNGILNYWFYLITNGGSGTNDNGDSYNVSPLDNNINVSRSKAGKIVFRSLTAYLGIFSQYDDAREATIQAARDLYPENETEVVEVITNAWCAVGVGQCGSNNNMLTLTNPNGGELWEKGATKIITWENEGNIAAVNIKISINGGDSWQTIATATNNDGIYIWEVPDMTTTQAMIRVEDSNNTITGDRSNNIFTIQGCEVVSNFESSAFEICQNESIYFESKSLNTVNYEWYIDNNLQSTSINFTHTFTTAGTYIIKLISTNENCIDEYTETITVYETPMAEFTYTTTGLTLNCYTTANANNYTWGIYGIENTPLNNNSHFEYTFEGAGEYIVCLGVNNDCDADDICESITISPTNACGNNEETWRYYMNADEIRALLEVGNYIYVGTNGSGLIKINQINGETTFFNTSNSDLPDNDVYALLEDSNGNIFVGTYGGGLAKFDGNNHTDWTIFNTENSDLPNNNIRALLESSSGEIFVGTYGGGLAKFDGNSHTDWTIFDTTSGLPSNNIRALLESSNGEIFVGTYGGGLIKFNGNDNIGSMRFDVPNSPLPSNNIYSLLESSSGEIFVGTNGGGLAKFDGNSYNYNDWTIFNITNSSLPNNYVYTLLESSNGEIFVGTSSSLAKFDGVSSTGWTIYTTFNSDLPNNNIQALLESSNSEIFVGGYYGGGLAKFDGSSYTDWIPVHISNSDLPDNNVYTLLESSNGEIFVGTYGSGLAKFDGNGATGWTIFNQANSDLSNNHVYALLEDNEGNIFVGTNGGLAKFDGNSATGWTIFNQANSGLPSNSIRTLLESSSGEIFVGTWQGGLAKFDGNSYSYADWTIFNRDHSDLPSDKVYAILESSSGDFFVGTNNGLAKFDGINKNTGWTIYRTTNSNLPHKTVNALLESNNSEIFVGTSAGLSKFDGIGTTGWTTYQSHNSDLPHNNIQALLKSNSGEIFVGTNNGGLAKFDGDSSTDWTVYNTSNSGLPNNYVRTLLESSNDEVFVGTSQGLSVLTPPSLIASFTIPSENICTNTEPTFTNTSIGTAYQWLINGSLISTTTDLQHTFIVAGEYSITLKAFDAEGCEDIYTQNIIVYNNATDLDLGTDITHCNASSLVMEANVTDMQSYLWQRNGTTLSTSESFTTTQSGTYTLTVTDMCGNTNSDTINVVIEEECVWPGDTNYDQIVNHHDLLPIGLGFGEFGFERLNASLHWEGQACQDWESVQEENEMNYKHIDTNGNGRIDANDALAITANYGKTHNNYSSNLGEHDSHISLDAAINIAETLGANNDTSVFVTTENTNNIIVIDLLVNEEDELQIASNGLAFDITYYLPPSLGSIENVTVNFEDSWLGTANELLTIWKHIPEANRIDIALSRFDKSNALGKGKIGEVVVEVDLEIISTEISQLDFEMSNISLVLSNNTFVPVGSTENTFTFVGEDVCITPTGLFESDITCNAITLNWDAMPNADIYRLRGRKADKPFKVFPDMTNNFRTFTGGLSPNTTYEWHVRTKCGDTWTDYAPLQSFTTPTCKNSHYDASKDPFLNETTAFFSQINLFPNPAKNDLHISFTSFSEENINVKVIDILGKTVLAEKIEILQGENNFDLNIETLQTGTYFLEIENGFERNIQKFLVL